MSRIILPLRDHITFAGTRSRNTKYGRKFPVMGVEFRLDDSRGLKAWTSLPMDAIVDTGTEQTLISERVAKAIKLPIESGRRDFKWIRILGGHHPSFSIFVNAHPLPPGSRFGLQGVPLWVRILAGCTIPVALIGRDFFVQDRVADSPMDGRYDFTLSAREAWVEYRGEE